MSKAFCTICVCASVYVFVYIWDTNNTPASVVNLLSNPARREESFVTPGVNNRSCVYVHEKALQDVFSMARSFQF